MGSQQVELGLAWCAFSGPFVPRACRKVSGAVEGPVYRSPLNLKGKEWNGKGAHGLMI